MKQIILSGEVGWSITDRLVSSLLPKDGKEDIEVSIQSYGGDAFEAFAIFNTLKQYPGKVKTIIKGIAASAAATIFLAGDTRAVYKNSSAMFHPAWGVCISEGEQMKSRGDMLVKITSIIADDLAGLMGKNKASVLEEMKNEIWLIGSSEIQSAGLADEVIDGDEDIQPESQSQAAAKVLNLIDRMKTNARAKQSDAVHQQVAASISHLTRTPEPNYPMDIKNAVQSEREKAAQIMRLSGAPKHWVDSFLTGADIQALEIEEVVQARLRYAASGSNDLKTGLGKPAQLPKDTVPPENKTGAEKEKINTQAAAIVETM